MDLTAPGLSNSVISLEPLNEAHREALRATDAVAHMWISMPAIQRGAGFDVYFDYMLRCAKDGTDYALAILDPRDNDRFVGVTAFLGPSRIHRRVGIGYTWIEESLRGKGVYDAIKLLMIQRAIKWGAKRIEWLIEAPNTHAIESIERRGAVREGVLRQYHKLADGTWVDVVVLSLLRDEANATIERLEEALATART
jgi:RimJ/RimL family protein N-acetyltransferase